MIPLLFLCALFAAPGEGEVGIPLDLDGDSIGVSPLNRKDGVDPSQEVARRELTRFLERVYLQRSLESGRRQLRTFQETDDAVARIQGGRSGGNEVCETFFSRARNSAQAREMGKTGILLAIAKGKLLRVSSGDIVGEVIRGIKAESSLKEECPRRTGEVRCLGTRFRSLNGVCNNVENPFWGAGLKPLARYLSADYFDGAQEPRLIGKDGSQLPSSRDVSRFLHTYRTGTVRPSQKELSLLFPAWAHFLYTDLVELSSWRGPGGACVSCCELSYHPECLNIWVSSSDRAFRGEECLPYSRLLPGVQDDCKLSERTPMNLATSYLDGSGVYGSYKDLTDSLREFDAGRLKTVDGELGRGETELPLPDSRGQRCRSDVNIPCFKYGAQGNNFLPIPLTLLWIREHNRIAGELGTLNPHWNDDVLFEEARRIVGAKIQYITFSEFLPNLLGKDAMTDHGLNLKSAGYFGGYTREMSSHTSVAFATAVGLFYHSLWPDEIGSLPRGPAEPTHTQKLSEGLYNPEWLYRSSFVEGMLRDAASRNPAIHGQYLSRELTENFLGNDLAGLIVQMGRDAGLRKYREWRRECGLPAVQSFQDLDSVVGIGRRDMILLATIYSSVDDVDLFTGGSVEPNIPGGLVGETFACILGSQFQAVRRGDRFWHENYFFPSAFTERQLATIRKASLARIICDNTDIEEIQPQALRAPDLFENCPVKCSGTVLERSDVDGFVDAEAQVSVPISEETLGQAVEYGTRIAAERRRRESSVAGVSNRAAAAFLHFLILQPNGHALEVSRLSESLLEATRVFLGRTSKALDLQLPQSLDHNVLQAVLPTVDVRNVLPKLPESECLKRNWPCDHSAPYRSMTGWCNNLRFPEYGTSFRPFRRLLQPHYDDGFNSPRTRGVSGGPLSSARSVSLAVHQSPGRNQPKYSHFIMQWGQFLDHDITLTPSAPGVDGNPLDCSGCDSEKGVSVNCFPIPIPPTDPFFPPFAPDGRPKCMGFTRSLLGQLTLGYREQMNEITAFIDGSNVYGADDCVAAELRELQGGLLKSQNLGSGRESMLPDKEHEGCKSRFNKCFFAGDVRANEQHGLTCTHTIWMREHNRLARGLRIVNPHWDDERLYQEARRILVAKLQRITYSEYLPKVLGLATMDEYDLLPLSQGYYTGYSEECDPGISNVFATAAYRFGHSLIQAELEMRDVTDRIIGVIPLRKVFFRADDLYDNPGYCDRFLKGMCGQASKNQDRSFVEGVTNRLFEEDDKPHSGLDLPALNIQRGRDHGLPPYTHYRRAMGLPVPRSFPDLYGIMENGTVNAMRSVYQSVEDIDVFSGLMSEKALKGALVGETTARLLGDQFQRLRRCDRFWYENGGQPGSFTTAQLAELRKTTMAKVLCKHAPEMNEIQEQVFSMPDDYLNLPLDCSKLEEMDLTHWRDQETCVVGEKVIGRGTTDRISPCISCTCTAEGVRCHSFRVKNCLDLLSEHSEASILEDDACAVQCGAFLDLGTNS